MAAIHHVVSNINRVIQRNVFQVIGSIFCRHFSHADAVDRHVFIEMMRLIIPHAAKADHKRCDNRPQSDLEFLCALIHIYISLIVTEILQVP